MIRLTSAGEKYEPREHHNIAAWGGIKELLRMRKDHAATREEVLEVLKYCWHWDPKFQPNTAYLGYALKNEWLSED